MRDRFPPSMAADTGHPVLRSAPSALLCFLLGFLALFSIYRPTIPQRRFAAPASLTPSSAACSHAVLLRRPLLQRPLTTAAVTAKGPSSASLPLEVSAPERFRQAVDRGYVQPAEAAALYRALPPVDEAFMAGSWAGTGFPTGHHLDGMLDAYGWKGKRFDSASAAHPLVFLTPEGTPVALNPWLVMPGIGLVKWFRFLNSEWAGAAFRPLIPLLTTSQAAAKLQWVEYEGTRTLAMQYDGLVIRDLFRRVDQDTVLATMDLGDGPGPAPFFFVLRRTVPWRLASVPPPP